MKARVITKNGQEIHYRDREKEVLFLDLRQMGSPFEKKFVELTDNDRNVITQTYHAWQQKGWEDTYKDIPEFCYSAKFEELEDKGYSLVPSKYIEFKRNDDNFNFDERIKEIFVELSEISKERAELDNQLKELFASYGLQ